VAVKQALELWAETLVAMNAARMTAGRVVHSTRKVFKAAAGAPGW
jgi:hypothetical protein